MLVFRILIRSGELITGEVSHLISVKVHENPGNIPEKIKSFIKEPIIWAQIKALEYIAEFSETDKALV